MTGLQKDILEIILKSQLMIEEEVNKRLNELYKLNNSTQNLDLIDISNTKMKEIKRQLNMIYYDKNNEIRTLV